MTCSPLSASSSRTRVPLSLPFGSRKQTKQSHSLPLLFSESADFSFCWSRVCKHKLLLFVLMTHARFVCFVCMYLCVCARICATFSSCLPCVTPTEQMWKRAVLLCVPCSARVICHTRALLQDITLHPLSLVLNANNNNLIAQLIPFLTFFSPLLAFLGPSIPSFLFVTNCFWGPLPSGSCRQPPAHVCSYNLRP